MHFLLSSSVEFDEKDSPQVLALAVGDEVSVGVGGCSARDGSGALIRMNMPANKENDMRIARYLE
jgi:hypothetical protein